MMSFFLKNLSTLISAKHLRAERHELHLDGRNEKKLAPLAVVLDAGFTVGDVCEESPFSQVTEDFAAPWDGLVYSAGTITLGSLRRITSTDFLHDFPVNAMGAALAIKVQPVIRG